MSNSLWSRPKELASAEYKKLGICINSIKEDNLVRYTQILEIFFLEISVPFVPCFENFEIFGQTKLSCYMYPQQKQIWLVVYSRSNLIGVKYISHSLTDPLTRS